MLIAQLIDPDYIRDFDHLSDIVNRAASAGVDLFFFGGSLITANPKFDIVKALKDISDIPVILFPSSPAHIDESADAILFLSLISGRNSEFLIGNHVAAAPILKKSSLEILPTGYILVGCGAATTAQYISNTSPVPYNKPEIAAATALAGEMLGLKLIYLDGGSGAEKPVSPEMVAKVKAWVSTPIIVGGGIKTTKDAAALRDAGADILVIGNGAEKRPEFISELSEIRV
ncbi:geranylgeranylglyceryl/heptaprenylglyceryl phosphate synthase [Cryomorpha ignava]|uniref:Geranylgeranylglyceryl phosphate synthase n=2 Tax=Cryomorpha ignava TaxID=101383 RepID=A0A7K3WQP2_9FLAO|nr:geranylgeranylglyceryl/heptaprenylglyceryl phosphate synthase [Cryomorpha ignava]